jgi:hypothetical protein
VLSRAPLPVFADEDDMSHPNDPESPVRWTPEDVERSLQDVRDELLDFLKERTRLDWFKHKVRWRLSRKFIWPGAPEGFREKLDQAVEHDAGVEAFMEHLEERHRAIATAIERHNLAIQRLMEQQWGVPVSRFNPEALAELRRRRITFQGTRDELLRRARELTPESGTELIPELLSLRLAILSEDVRDEIFSQVAAILAGEKADRDPDMTPAARDRLAQAIELRLRCLDRYHVARLLAENYPEARRLMNVDPLLQRFETLRQAEREAGTVDPGREENLATLREVLLKMLAFLEQIFPTSAGTHERERRLLGGGTSPTAGTP